jgi:hypothetical protein
MASVSPLVRDFSNSPVVVFTQEADAQWLPHHEATIAPGRSDIAADHCLQPIGESGVATAQDRHVDQVPSSRFVLFGSRGRHCQREIDAGDEKGSTQQRRRDQSPFMGEGFLSSTSAK